MTETDKTSLVLNRMQLLIGLLLLVAGCLFYITARVPADVYFTRFFGLETRLHVPDTFTLGTVGPRLPAFIHVCAFSLMTASLMENSKKKMISVCLGWFLVNFVFEMGQKYKQTAASLVPDSFRHLPFLDTTRSYFLNGTFDWLDVAAAAAGAGAAYLIWLTTKRYHYRGKSHETQF